MPTKILSLIDIVLTPLVNIVPANVRKVLYASLPVVLAVLSALDGSGILSGQVAIWVGGIYSALNGLVAAANTVVPAKKPAASVAPPASK